MIDLSCLYDKSKYLQLLALREKIDDPSLFEPAELEDLALLCLSDLETYTCIMFLAVEGYPFQVKPFHRVLFRLYEDIRDGKYTRVIINIPPGFGKTHTFVAWVAQSYQIEPKCKFLHLSYSDQLVNDNSDNVKVILSTPIARAIAQVRIKSDTRGKSLWKTTDGGVFRAVATGGQVTGFRAGRLGFSTLEGTRDNLEDVDDGTLDRAINRGIVRVEDAEIGEAEEEFCGACGIDDPIKPEDANSAAVKNKINERFPGTIASRLATERVPIVLIQQRIDGMDLSGFLLGGGSGEKWHHMVIPPEITEEDLDPSKYPEYSKAWLYGVPLQHGLPLGPIWPEKLDEAGISAKKRDESVWFAQYRQRPKPKGGRMFLREWFPRYQSIDGWDLRISCGDKQVAIEYYMVFGDTAQKTGEQHDYSVFELYAKGSDGRIYLIDMIRGKYTAPELEVAAITFLDRYEYQEHVWSMSWRQCWVEDKVSGTGLIQAIGGLYSGRMEPMQRNRDKYVRACDCERLIKTGRVVLPESAIWLDDLLLEVEAFSRDLAHDFDDQLDPMFDACTVMLDSETEADYNQFSGQPE